MKFLFKLAVLVVAARLLAGSPRGASREIDAVAECTVRDMAHAICATFDKIEVAAVTWWKSPPVPRSH